MVTEKEIIETCNYYNIQHYTINDDMSVDVNDNVTLYNYYLTKLPLNFNTVFGCFYCENNKLTSLKGCPKYVGDWFDCSRNLITSLEHGPLFVEGSYMCKYNNITTRQIMVEFGEDIYHNNLWKF